MWEPRAVIVLILAGAVSIAHVVGVIALAWHGKPLGETGGEVLIAVLGAIIAIVAAYVGKGDTNASKTRPGDPPDTSPDKTTQPDVSGSTRSRAQAGEDEPSPRQDES